MFMKQDHKAIAEIIAENTTSKCLSDIRKTGEYIALNLADYFERDNPHFDRAKFMAACGL